MDSVNKTLYIPLYGKALVSRRGIVLRDPSAEAIWETEGFPLKGKSASSWLALYMAMRARVFDDWLRQQLKAHADAVVIQLGCGLDSRILRVEDRGQLWLDVDFPDVIEQRKGFFREDAGYRMAASDVRDPGWLEDLPGGSAIVLLEGISMYLRPEELLAVLAGISRHFDRVFLLMDCYSTFAAKASRYKNPINDVGVTQVYGMDDPKAVEQAGLCFVKEHPMTPDHLIQELKGIEKTIFRKLYAGKTASRMYHLYEYEKASR